ncbi:TAXI family TRAP transporter solute-binding subunit [Halomonas mongoliensis]|uniref:TAXI family TRAP transporter solute-binding subunit n=1 Tax=Halomonas mongoliensis TaxID=321265 RepID=UPI00403ADBDD
MKTDNPSAHTTRRAIPAMSLLAGAMLLSSGTAQAQELPSSMMWGAYDVGSSGYAEASAIADAFGREFGTRVRIQPSGSAIGRLQPLVNGRTDYAFLATEAFFASEGTYDFADRSWGPQDLRALGGRPASGGLVTAADANIRQISDVEGKRVAYVAGNPSINIKLDAMLAFAGLTRDDVDAITFPTYAAAMSSLSEGRSDATFTVTTPSQMYELAESPRGIHWVEIPPDDEDGWGNMSQVAPIFSPFEESVGAGLSEENSVNMVAYRYPMVVTRSDLSDDEAYAFIKAIDEAYNLYKDATAVMYRWEIDLFGTPPLDVPFHDGAIRYLEEKGIWTDEHQVWNDERKVRLESLIAAWDDAMEEGGELSDDDFSALWEERRNSALKNAN